MKNILKHLTCWAMLIGAAQLSFAGIELEETEKELAKDYTGVQGIPISGDGDWKATTSNDCDWISIPSTRASGTGSSKNPIFRILSCNYSTDVREGVVYVNNLAYTVRQLAYDATISPTSVDVPSDGAGITEPAYVSFSIDGDSSITFNWTAKVDDASCDWVTVEPSSGTCLGGTTNRVSYTVRANTTKDTRMATLTIAGQRFVINQAAAGSGDEGDVQKVTLSPSRTTLPYPLENNLEVSVTADAGVTWEIENSNSWIDVFNSGAGIGTSTINLSVLENKSVLTRTGYVTIGDATLTVVQKGTTDYKLTTDPTSESIEYKSASPTINVEASDDLDWVVHSLNSWLTIQTPRTLAGSGNGTVKYQVALNPELTPRMGVIEVAARIPHPEVELSRGLMQWQGVGQALNYECKSASLRDANVEGETEGVWFVITDHMNSLHRLFDLNNGDAGLYVTEQNRLVLETADGTVTDLSLPIEQSVTYDVFLAASSTNTVIYGGTHGGSAYRKLGTCGEALKITGYGRSTRPTTSSTSSEMTLVWGSASTKPYYYWTRTLNENEMANFPSTKPTIAMDSPVSSNLVSHASFDRQFVRSSSGTETALYVSNIVYKTGRTSLTQNAMTGTMITPRQNYLDGIRWVKMVYTSSWYYKYVDVGSFESLEAWWKSEQSSGEDYSLTEETKRTTYRECSYNLWVRLGEPTTAETSEVMSFLCSASSGYDRYNDYSSKYSEESWYKAWHVSKQGQFGLQYAADGLHLVADGVVSQAFGTPSEIFDRWVMLTLTSNGSKLTLYVDGVDVGNVTLGGTYKRFVQDCWILHGNNGNVVFDDLKVFDACLSTSQIKELYDSEKPLVARHVVTQTAATPTLSETEQTCGATNAEFDVTLTLPSRVIKWTASTDADWITVGTTNGTGSATNHLTVAKNSETYARRGVVTIAGIEYVIVQEGTGVSFEKTIWQIAYDGTEALEIPVIATDDATHWTVEEDIDRYWWMFADVTEGYGSSTLPVWGEPNGNDMDSRYGILRVSGVWLYIFQRNYELSVSPASTNVTFKAVEDGQITVMTEEAENGNWQAITDVDWITLLDAEEGEVAGSGSGTVAFKVAANTSATPRVGRIVVAGETCVITQGIRGVVTGLEIAGPTEVLSGETATFSASLAYSGGGHESVTPTWTIIPENGVASIDAQSGVLTAGASAGTVTLNAAVEADGVEWRTNCLVTVTLKPTALSILGGATKICPNESRALAFVVTYTDDSTASVSPTEVSVTSGDATVTADGVLTAGQTAGEIVVMATYEAVGVKVSTNWTATLVAPTTKEALGTDADLTVSGWHAVAGTSHEGDFSLKADAAAVGETREASATFSGAGTLSTWLKVSSASRGEIVIDGAVVTSLTGDVDWTNVVNVVSSWDTHTVVWRYVKEVEDDAFEDAMWIDSIMWTAEKLRVTALDISGIDSVLVGKTATYGCRATWVDGKEEDVSPVWSIIEGGRCATIDASTGVLTAVNDGTVTIRAAYTFDGETTTQTKQVTIRKNVKSIAISGETSVYAGTENSYLCVATYTDGSTEEVADVDWSLVSGEDSVTLAADGTVTAQAVETDGTATIKAVYTFGGVDFSATKSIAIKATFSVPESVTGGATQVLPMAWPNQYPQFAEKFGADPVAAMSKATGKRDAEGRDLTVWHDYVAGTDPTDVSDVFRAKIEMVDGQPVVSWEPNLNEAETLRTYRVYGSPSLGDDAEWTWPPNANTHRFFKVNVSMPDAADEAGGTESDSPGVIEPWTAATPPTIQANLVYNGSSQTGVSSGEGYTLSGNTAADAGTYTATATLESGYKWSDGVTDTARTFVWSIAQAENEWLVEPSLSSTDFKFRSSITVQTGKPRFGTAVANYTTTDLSGLSAGTYSFVSQVSETSNYGALEKTIPFVVRPWDAVLPSAKTGLVYTGQTQTGVFSGNGYTLTGNTAVNAGTYVATATLKTGYKWSDGSTSTTRTITWSIAAAQNKWQVEPSLSKTVFYEGDTITVQVGTPLFGTATANYTVAELSKLSVGTYEFVSKVSSSGNYTALTKTISFVVRQKSELYSTGKYLVINLEDGSRTSLDDVPTGGWTDEYKTTKLVLRRCSAGADPLGRYTLTQDFYAGVFEVTQKQWQMIMDSDEGWTDSYGLGDTYPAYYVSYNEIRGSSAGAKWPSSSEVDDDSFVGKLRTKTGLATLDLPTGAQWEYACRAGMKTAYNTGDGASSLALAGWYISNSENTAHSVGLKQANKWDLYDMHGNVSEWTLDWHGGSLAGNDPVGAATGSYRDIRGGGWSSASIDAESSYSSYFYYPTLESTGTGFRIFMTVP